MEDSRASRTIEELNDRIVQLENRIERTDEEFADETPDLFEIDSINGEVKKEETTVDAKLEVIRERLDRLEDSSTIVMELEKMRAEKKDSNSRLKTMNATYITRMVLEAIAIIALSVLIVGCTFDFPSHGIRPEKLNSSTWTCVPTVMDDMEVMKIMFDENGVDGNVFFMTRGEVKTRNFTTNDNEILFAAPPLKWLFYTDYDRHLTIEYGDKEVEFTRVGNKTE